MNSSIHSNSLATHFPENQEEQGIDFIGLFKHLWVHKWPMIIIATVTYLIAYIYASSLIPIYRTSALLKVDQQTQSVIGVEAASQAIGQSYRSSSAEIILIKSQRVIAKVIDELNLGYSITPRYYRYFGAEVANRHTGEGLAKPLFGLSEYAWGGEILDLQRFAVSGDMQKRSSHWKLIADEPQQYRLLASNGDQVLSGKVGERVTAEYKGSTIEIFVRQLRARPGVWFSISRPSNIASTESLQSQLKVSSEGDSVYRSTGILKLSMEGRDPQEITEIINAVSHAYVKQNIEDQSKVAQQKLDFIDSQLPAMKGNLEKAQRSLQEYRQKVDTIDIEYDTQAALSQYTQYGSEISELQLKKEDMRRKFTETNPEIVVISRQIERLREKRKEIEIKLQKIPEKEWEIIQKTRDVELATDLYVVLLNKAQELRVAKAGMIGNVQVIDLAAFRPWPVKPNRAKVRSMGLMIGILLGLAWVYIRHLLHNKVVDPVLVEKETGLHVYANIPHSPHEKDISSRVIKRGRKSVGEARLLACEHDTDLAVEALRSFRTSMRFAMRTADNNVVIIGGPSPSIGKSFFASNYAAVTAKEGQRVLLVDADLRKGHLHHYMGEAIKPGLSELIANDVSLEEVVHEVAENLYFISAGERPPNPAELLSSNGFQQVLKQMQDLYDLVIIDTPPILAVTDASVIAQYGGQLFVLLRCGQHQMDEIHAAISVFEKNGVNVTGLLFNDLDDTARGYGYGYRYEYKSS